MARPATELQQGVGSRDGVRNRVRSSDAELLQHDVVVPKYILCNAHRIIHSSCESRKQWIAPDCSNMEILNRRDMAVVLRV